LRDARHKTAAGFFEFAAVAGARGCGAPSRETSNTPFGLCRNDGEEALQPRASGFAFPPHVLAAKRQYFFKADCARRKSGLNTPINTALQCGDPPGLGKPAVLTASRLEWDCGNKTVETVGWV